MGDDTVQLTFGIDDPQLEDERRSQLAANLLQQLRSLDVVERVDRAEMAAPEVGSRPGFATLVGFLTAEVNRENLGKFLTFLGDRLGDKPMKLCVKAGGGEVTIEARSRRELAEVEAAAHRLLDRLDGE